MISIKCLPISTTIIHREENPSVWHRRQGHTVQKMQLHLDSACRPTCLKQPITLCLDVKICYLIRVSHKGRKLHSPSILIQTFLAAALPAVQILAAVYRVNTEFLQLSLLQCIFYYFIHSTALFWVHDLLAFELYSFHAPLHALH